MQIYGCIAAYIYYKKKNDEERYKIFYNIEHEDQTLKDKAMINFQ